MKKLIRIFRTVFKKLSDQPIDIKYPKERYLQFYDMDGLQRWTCKNDREATDRQK